MLPIKVTRVGPQDGKHGNHHFISLRSKPSGQLLEKRVREPAVLRTVK